MEAHSHLPLQTDSRTHRRGEPTPSSPHRWDSVFDYSAADPPNFSLLADAPPLYIPPRVSGSDQATECPVALAPFTSPAAAPPATAPPPPVDAWSSAVEGGGATARAAPREQTEEPDVLEELEELEDFSASASDSDDAPAPRVVPEGRGGRPARPASAKGKTRSEKVFRELASAEMYTDGTRGLGSHAAAGAVAVARGGAASPAEELAASTVDDLHALLLGSASAEWSPAWRYQGFDFSKEPATPYGLLQKHGGSCGVMAAVQAFLVRFLVAPPNPVRAVDLTSPSPHTLGADATAAALLEALCDVLLLATEVHGAQGGMVRVVLCSKETLPVRRSLVGALACHSVAASRAELRAFLRPHLPAFSKSGGSGVVLFLYSVLLTRGLETTRSQMDASAALVDRRGYCSQELVNTLCVGEAVSNVFDGSRTLGDGAATAMVRGLSARSPVGLLCLAESLGHCEVGAHYKRPAASVWLCYMESHYSLVFSPTGATPSDDGAPFQLVYYDPLGHQDEHILLSLTPGAHHAADDDGRDLVPPLDQTLRTRWPGAGIDWGDTEPLL